MQNWFECKIKYQKINEYGQEKPVAESYLVDALSFTEAESRLIKMLETELSEDFIVTGITKAKLEEVIPFEGADYWYKCKVVYKDIDEKSGKEKATQHQVLVAADDFKAAFENVSKSQEQVLVPWEIQQIALTKIVDVFPYEVDDEGENENNLTDEDVNYISDKAVE
ncbi:MAG: phage tail protein [Salinivirgaceae bacterium]|nr:MAG: phage tail protein [Salinivirgaceae bacterium]